MKIGLTGRNPRTRAAEITSVSGLLAPCTIACCAPAADILTAEQAVHRMLDAHPVRERRELFRVDVTMVRQVIEVVALFLVVFCPPQPPTPHATLAMRSRAAQFRQLSRRLRSCRYGRQRPSEPVRLTAGLMMVFALIALLKPLLSPYPRRKDRTWAT